ncbi:MAG: protoheme IX farnesyltransferase [Chlorobi bacterium]|nr:protoheme IX farnesyltransferase [Chlorobiota bacterium]
MKPSNNIKDIPLQAIPADSIRSTLIGMLKLLLELNKVKITFAVMLTTMVGYLLAGHTFDAGIILPTLGIFILACGSSAFNHFQDRDRDALMERTKNRPIPSGRINNTGVLFIAVAEIVAGTFLIYIGSNFLAAQLGLLALIWYNGIYTPLKRRTAFAVIPGSIIGSLPPMVGWVAGGGSLTDPRLFLLAFFFFIWQVPHFWLLMLKYGQEYIKAGYPSITSMIGKEQIKRATFMWTAATAVAAIMVALSGLISLLVFKIIIVVAAIWLIIVFSRLLGPGTGNFKPMFYFMRINYFVLVMIVVMSIDPLI